MRPERRSIRFSGRFQPSPGKLARAGGWNDGLRRKRRGDATSIGSVSVRCFNPYSAELMLKLAVLFLIIAIGAGIFGFGGIAGTSAWIAQVLFAIFLILFVISFFFGRKAST